ncbi:hypothetical protein [Anaerolinea sp.]|uniref:hypothetical protein n=1 Tax=Anaerolinea sp. TaxID=1872519 RepID=UPI002ACDC3CD|nr:hypothetical protein [Anaerolinea sp.]
MRKLIFLLVSLLLAGCGLAPTPTPSPTPRPTVTPTEEVRFMPTADIDTAKTIHEYFSNHVKQSPWQTVPETRVVISSLVSTGETGSMEVYHEQHVISVDYLVAYDYIYLGFGVPTVKVAYGIYDQEKYFYLLGNEFWEGKDFSQKQAQEDVAIRFPKGSLVGVNFYGDGFVSRDLRVHWDKCKDVFQNSKRNDAIVFCDVGAELEKRQSVSDFTQRATLKFQEDWVVLGILSDYPNEPISLP